MFTKDELKSDPFNHEGMNEKRVHTSEGMNGIQNQTSEGMNGLSEARMKVHIDIEIKEGRKQSFSLEEVSADMLLNEVIAFIKPIVVTESQQKESSSMSLYQSQEQPHYNSQDSVHSNAHTDTHKNDIHFQPQHGSHNLHNSPIIPQGDTLTIKERLELFLKAEYGNRWFRSLEVKQHYEQAYGSYINLSTVSTYCARMYRDGILERRGNRIQREYHLIRQRDRYATEASYPVRHTI